MKNYFFIILLFLYAISQAQIVNIPDENFKNAVKSELGITTDPTEDDMLNLSDVWHPWDNVAECHFKG